MNICGRIKCNKNDLDLSLTLLGGQSFRWKKISAFDDKNMQKQHKFIGVMYNNFWELQHDDTGNYLLYKVYCDSSRKKSKKSDIENLLKYYFRLDINLQEYVKKWKHSSEHFHNITTNAATTASETDDTISTLKENHHQFSRIRLLDQEPFENIISFLCSQNNNIQRITKMIEWFTINYGEKICDYDGNEYYTFPSIEKFHQFYNNNGDDEDSVVNFENQLKSAKFGYRSKYITKTIQQIILNGGNNWLKKLKLLTYTDARNELLKLNGIGPKVADCICLMSLNHLESVPIDTHMYKIAQKYYLIDNTNLNDKDNKASNRSKSNRKTQNITPVLYEKIGDMFRKIYGPYAGWAQLVLFCSDLKKFKEQ